MTGFRPRGRKPVIKDTDMRKTLFALIALSALLAATSLPAKEPRNPKTPKPGYGTVTGRTTTPQEFRPGGSPYERTFTPIRGASITAITSQGDTLRDISDQIGIYALGRVPEGKIIMRVEAKGYKTQIAIKEVVKNRTLGADFEMEKAESPQPAGGEPANATGK